MKYKMIAADMDGTLLDDRKNIPPKTLTLIKRAINEGIVFAFSTGRPPQAVFKYRDILDSSAHIIAYNGAMILDSNDNIFFEQGLLDTAAREVLKYVKFYDTTACIWSGNKLYVNKLNKRAAKYKINVMTEPLLCSDEEMLLNRGITKILVYDTPERTLLFQNELQGKLPVDVTFCPSTPEYLEFFNSKVSKGLAIERIAKNYGIKPEEIIAFGDNCNDIEMLEYAGLGVAMGNAHEATKRSADFITLSNNDEGVAYALEKYLF